jgi:hypothetical protein
MTISGSPDTRFARLPERDHNKITLYDMDALDLLHRPRARAPKTHMMGWMRKK